MHPALENTGIALSMGVLRFGWFCGGDGESQLRVDGRNIAGFARYQAASITNFLLPVKVSWRTWVLDEE